jgi:large subunit ribosomal protein L37Ae
MAKTKKVYTAGRFGARYGVGIKQRVVEVEKKQRILHECPKCGFKRAKRISTGLYECRKCNTVFTGGAYYPQTTTGRLVAKAVKQRAFKEAAEELLKLREEEKAIEMNEEKNQTEPKEETTVKSAEKQTSENPSEKG